MKKLLLISLCIIPIISFSQNLRGKSNLLSNQIEIPNEGLSTFLGIITDEESGEPLPFVNVVLEKNGVQITGATSDFDGHFYIYDLEPGEYNMNSSSVGYEPHEMNFTLDAETKYFYDCRMKAGYMEITYCCFNCGCSRLILNEEEKEPLPITDLFADQDSMELAEAEAGPPSSIDEKSQPLLRVFPNPVQSELTISGLMGIEQLIVIDLSGKLLQQISIQEVPSVSLNVESFIPGVYLIQFEKEGKPQVQRFIKH